jgi:hypothetical protein
VDIHAFEWNCPLQHSNMAGATRWKCPSTGHRAILSILLGGHDSPCKGIGLNVVDAWFSHYANSGNTTQCKVTSVILHGVGSTPVVLHGVGSPDKATSQGLQQGRRWDLRMALAKVASGLG